MGEAFPPRRWFRKLRRDIALRFPDGADEIHQMRIAQRAIAAYKDFGTTRSATGDLPV